MTQANTGRTLTEAPALCLNESFQRCQLLSRWAGARCGLEACAGTGRDLRVRVQRNHVQLRRSASKDNDGTITSYAWNFGDGTTGSGATVSHTCTAPPNYTVTLTVTDNGGAIGFQSKTVKVVRGK
jgi:PKD domain